MDFLEILLPDWLQGLLIGGVFLIAGALTLGKLWGPFKLISLALMIVGGAFMLGFITVGHIQELIG